MSEIEFARFLIVRATGDMRVVKTPYGLRGDEVAYRLRVRLPAGWGKIQDQEIVFSIPECITAVDAEGQPLRSADPQEEKGG